MSVVKLINSGYKSPEQMMNLINYIVSDQKHKINGMTGGNMILTGTPQYIYDQMMYFKNCYNKAHGRFMRHIIVSLSEFESQSINDCTLYLIAAEICNLFPEHQSLFAIHHETGRPHIHIALNTVSFTDGAKIRINLAEVKTAIGHIFAKYVSDQHICSQPDTCLSFYSTYHHTDKIGIKLQDLGSCYSIY